MTTLKATDDQQHTKDGDNYFRNVQKASYGLPTDKPLKASEIFDVEPETPPKLEEKANTYVKAWYLRTLPIVDLDNEGVEIPPPTQKEWESTVKRDLHRFMREAREEGYEAGYKTAVKDFSSRTCPYCHKSSKLYTREEWDKM